MPKIDEIARILQEKGPLGLTDITVEYVRIFISQRKVDEIEFYRLRNRISVCLGEDQHHKRPRFKHIVTHWKGVRGVWDTNARTTR